MTGSMQVRTPASAPALHLSLSATAHRREPKPVHFDCCGIRSGPILASWPEHMASTEELCATFWPEGRC